MKFSISNPFTEDLAIDLGTVHTFIYARERGMVVNEPSLVAIDRVTNEVVASGNEALEMLGRSPEDVEVVYPMREGVVADSELAQKMLGKFVRKARGSRARFSRRVTLGVPSGITSVERFAINEVIKGIGVSRVYLVEEGLAAAIGAKLPVTEMKASMVMDIGGGSTSIAVVANSGIVESETLRIGGLDMDHAIINYIKHHHRVLIGERTAERLKMVLGSAAGISEEHKSVVKGQNVNEGGPEVIEVTAPEIHQAINGIVKQMVEAARQVLERVPPEVASDIHDSGMVLTGGIALLAGMDERISQATKLKVNIAESPRQSVGRGLIALYDQPLLLRRVARNVELS
ncbi:MAG TPA: rod shape-determining protein [Blastocatellia bacterium]|nr:rod shape-determining protein [Blastocatellia bacterium]